MPNPTSKGQSPDLVIRSFDKSSMMLVKELKFESVVKPLFRTTPLYCWNKDSYSEVALDAPRENRVAGGFLGGPRLSFKEAISNNEPCA